MRKRREKKLTTFACHNGNCSKQDFLQFKNYTKNLRIILHIWITRRFLSIVLLVIGINYLRACLVSFFVCCVCVQILNRLLYTVLPLCFSNIPAFQISFYYGVNSFRYYCQYILLNLYYFYKFCNITRIKFINLVDRTIINVL